MLDTTYNCANCTLIAQTLHIFCSIVGVAELVDAEDLKSSGRKSVRVRVPPSAISVTFKKLIRKKFSEFSLEIS